jgi:hypothetical protein
MIYYAMIAVGSALVFFVGVVLPIVVAARYPNSRSARLKELKK